MIPRLCRWLGRTANRVLGPMGLVLLRTESPPDPMAEMLGKLKGVIAQPACVIDLGAARGAWTRAALECFPGVKALMVEPLVEHEAILRDLSHQYPRAVYELAAVGSEEGVVDFHVSEDLDGSGVYGCHETPVRQVPLRKLDDLVRGHGIGGPYVIKFDTHGYEVPILQGGRKTLAEASAIIMECYNFKISPTSLYFWEMCQEMGRYGFRPFDYVGTVRRPTDRALWQMDIIFLRADNNVFRHQSYRVCREDA